MPGYDPSCGVPYGQWLRDKGVNGNLGGLSRTERVIDEGRLPSGERYQTRKDELGTRIRERSASLGVSTGQDVTVMAPRIAMESRAVERRDA